MKNKTSYFWVIALLLVSTSALAQRPRYRPQVHEISLQLGTFNWSPLYADGSSASPFQANVVNGIRYRFHNDPHYAVRIGLFYRKNNWENAAQVPVIFGKSDINYKAIELRLGYEYKYHLMKWQWFVAVDALLSSTAIDSKFGAVSNQQTSEDSYISYGFSGATGLRYFFSKQLSLSVEADFYTLFNKGGHAPSDQETPKNWRAFPQREVGFHLFSAAINFHFKRMKKSCVCGKPGS